MEAISGYGSDSSDASQGAGASKKQRVALARALKSLQHAHIVRMFSHAVDDNFIYVALEPFVALPLVAGQRCVPSLKCM